MFDLELELPYVVCLLELQHLRVSELMLAPKEVVAVGQLQGLSFEAIYFAHLDQSSSAEVSLPVQ